MLANRGDPELAADSSGDAHQLEGLHNTCLGLVSSQSGDVQALPLLLPALGLEKCL